MADFILRKARMAWRMASAAIPLLCVTAFGKSAEVGPSDWLFQISVKNRVNASSSNGRQLLVLLPSACILSKGDMEKYLAWCMEAHKSFKGGICSSWDVDDIEFREPANANLAEKMASFLRRGDSARDPSGTLSLVVTGIPEDGDATFKLGLAEQPLAPETATPAICLTNLWVLPREELFAHWEKEIEAGKDGEVFDDICRLAKSGRYRLPGGHDWEKAVREFRERHPRLRPSIVFRNESEKPVHVKVKGETKSLAISPGESRSFAPTGERRRVEWEVRPADDAELGDNDYSWASGSTYWDPEDMENAIMHLSPASIGSKLEKWPSIKVTNSFKASVRLTMAFEDKGQADYSTNLTSSMQYTLTPRKAMMPGETEMKLILIAES